MMRVAQITSAEAVMSSARTAKGSPRKYWKRECKRPRQIRGDAVRNAKAIGSGRRVIGSENQFCTHPVEHERWIYSDLPESSFQRARGAFGLKGSTNLGMVSKESPQYRVPVCQIEQTGCREKATFYSGRQHLCRLQT